MRENECWFCTRGADTLDLRQWNAAGSATPWTVVWPLPPHGLVCQLCADEMQGRVGR